MIQSKTKPIRFWAQSCNPGCPAQRSLPSAPSQGVTYAGPRLGVGAAPRQSGQEIADLAKGEAVVQCLQWVDAGHHGAAFKPCRANSSVSVREPHPPNLLPFQSPQMSSATLTLSEPLRRIAPLHQSKRAAELIASP